jgi:hypothetical protein
LFQLWREHVAAVEAAVVRVPVELVSHLAIPMQALQCAIAEAQQDFFQIIVVGRGSRLVEA